MGAKKEVHSSDETSGEEIWEDGSDGFAGDDSNDSENFAEMVSHENDLTKKYWIPTEPHLYVLSLG